jgi:peptidoglycan/LPS O-acetylase OafA/YrhL
LNDRVNGLEGMRGLAAFWVYTHHFLLIFYPVFYFGQHTWINNILNPDLAVSWFFVHSGFVLAWKSRNTSGPVYKRDLIDHAIRRYFRLLPPVIFTILCTYIILKMGLTFNVEYGKVVNSSWLGGYLNFKPDIFEALKQSFYSVYFNFKSSTTYDPNLWTIGYELISSYLLFAALALFGWWKKSMWLFLILGLVVGPWKGLMCFMLGAFLTRIPKHKTHPFFLGFFVIVGFYVSNFKGAYADYVRNLGAGLLMYALLQAPTLRDILAKKYIQRLGDISYSLYALHFLLLATLTSYLGLKWEAHLDVKLAFLVYLITTGTLLIVSYYAWKWVDRPGIELSKRISRYFL